jgi:class 3 adenylate cyclase/predicted ATPase
MISAMDTLLRLDHHARWANLGASMDLGGWLRSLGLEQYEAAFRENAIDETVLHDLTEDHLREIGIPLGARLKLLKAIAVLGARAEATRPSADGVSPGPPVGAAERRQVTVMFSDLVGSTALAARMDPEDLREVISAYQKCVAETVRRFDGFVAKFLGDGVLIYFGYPQAHEDDAERAVRAGLELIAAVGGLRTHASLQTRVGIATGLVVVGDLIGSGEAQERGIVGETPNLAARMQGVAEPNMVVVAESTRRLLGNLFELQDLGDRDLKGVAVPARAWSALRPSSVASRFEALHASGLTDLVGREEESELLLRHWSRAKAGEGQVVLLTGEPGIGKSRLTAALLERLATEPHTRLRYFCSPQHTDSALFPIIGQMQRAAGLAHDDAPGARLDKLDALLAQTATSIEDAALFAEMLSLPNDGRYPALDLDPQERRQKTLQSLVWQLEALTRSNPVLMIFEDAHWTDPTSLELFSRAVDRIRTLRVLLIVTFRPEFDPPWIGRPYVTALTINRLAECDVSAMIDRLVGNKPIPASIRQDIIERTDGIPLFIEEMTKAVLEADSQHAAERTVAAAPSLTLAVPASLHASLMARLDRLGPAKEVAQIGAAIGRAFSHALLAAVVRKPEPELASALDRLIAAGLLFRQGVQPHATYLFKHSLVRDAAYGTLLREHRRALHARIAQELQSVFPEVERTEPEFLAYHLTEAGATEDAVRYWLAAGKNAAQRSANREAINHCQRGLGILRILPDSRRKDGAELDLQVALGTCLIATEGTISDRAVATFTRARQLCEGLQNRPEYLQVLYWLPLVLAARGEMPEAAEALAVLLSTAEARDDWPAQLNALRGLALNRLLMGRLTEAREFAERAVAKYDDSTEEHKLAARSAGQDAGVASLAVMSWVLWFLGYADSAALQISTALRRAETLKHPHSTAYARYYASVLHALRGELEIAHQHAECCFSLSEEHGFQHWRGLSRCMRLVCGMGLDLARSKERANELNAMLGNRYQFAAIAIEALFCEALLVTEQFEVALDVFTRCLATANRTSERLFEAELHRLRGCAVLRMGGPDATMTAQREFYEALQIAQQQKARSFELRAATSLARLWRGQGSADKARELLTPIYGWFTEGFGTLDLKQAKTLLDELAS